MSQTNIDSTFFDTVSATAVGVIVATGVVTSITWLGNKSEYALTLATFKNVLCPTLLLVSLVITTIITVSFVLWKRALASEYSLFTVIFLSMQIVVVVGCTESTPFRNIAMYSSIAVLATWTLLSLAIRILKPAQRR